MEREQTTNSIAMCTVYFKSEEGKTWKDICHVKNIICVVAKPTDLAGLWLGQIHTQKIVFYVYSRNMLPNHIIPVESLQENRTQQKEIAASINFSFRNRQK